MAQAPLKRALGAWLLLAQPAVIVSQLVVASRWVGDYDLTVNTVSDLGTVSCTTITAAYGPVEVCSPWHALMNATFFVIGAFLTLGALLLAADLGASRRGRIAVGLLVVAGVSSSAVGLAPLDRDGGLHALVATPLFITQPLALLLLGAGQWKRSPGLAIWLVVTGLSAAIGSSAFVITLLTGEVGGLWERIGLWSCHIGLGGLGLVLLTSYCRTGDRHLRWRPQRADSS